MPDVVGDVKRSGINWWKAVLGTSRRPKRPPLHPFRTKDATLSLVNTILRLDYGDAMREMLNSNVIFGLDYSTPCPDICGRGPALDADAWEKLRDAIAPEKPGRVIRFGRGA